MGKLGILVAICLAGGCATIMSGEPAHIPVATNPPGANVFLDGQFVGQTPTVVVVPKEALGAIHIEAQGFMPIDLRRYKGINGWFWANICWGVFPMIVDLATGYYETFDDTPIALGMTPGSYAPQPGQEQQPPPPAGYPQPAPPPGYPGTQPTPQPQPPGGR